MSDKKEKVKLLVEKRKLNGSKVKLLRKQAILPANIYGRKVKSLAVQVDLKAFLPILKETGETGLVELKVKGEDKIRPVLIHNVQYHAVNDEPLHADFYQVDLKEKVTTKIPVELVSESPAVKNKIGILIQPLNEIEVEALPTDLPEKIEVNISSLEKINDAVLLKEVKLDTGVKVLSDVNQILVKIDPPAKEEEVAPVEEEVKEGEEEKEEGKEGEEVAEEEKEAPRSEEKKEKTKAEVERKEPGKEEEKPKE
jgi:large subunit ribosomal protein L25